MASILHQQTADRCRDEVSRDRETAPGHCDCLKEADTVLPFIHHPYPYQLSIELSTSKAECFKSSIEVGD